MDDPRPCNLSVRICLSFYGISKKVIHLFLVERAYLSSTALPSTRPSRIRSPVFMIGVTIIIVTSVLLGALIFKHSLAFVAETDHTCRIGIPRDVAIPLLANDLSIHLGLTLYFLIKSWRSFYGLKFWQLGAYFKLAIRHIIPKCENAILISLMVRSLAGLVLIIIPTIANVATLVAVNGREKVWLCWIVCTVDSEIYPAPKSRFQTSQIN